MQQADYNVVPFWHLKRKTMDDFDDAVALFVSYAMEGNCDARLTELLRVVREMYSPDAFDRLLVLFQAATSPRFTEYRCADTMALLRNFEVTADVRADAERLLDLMQASDAEAATDSFEGFLHSLDVDDPMQQAAERALRKYGPEMTLQEAMSEIQSTTIQRKET
jgi:hypothetical protein